MSTRLEEINSQLKVLHDERHTIQMEEIKQENIKNVGRYFCEWKDTGDSYTVYVAARSVDEYGSLCGYYFEKYDDGKVLFSDLRKAVVVDGFLPMPEISEEKFFDAWHDVTHPFIPSAE
jgi:hypothetical protein